MSSFGLQMLNASHTLVPALGSREAEKMRKVYLHSDRGHNFEVRSGRMARDGFSPGGGKTQGVWGTGVWLGLEIDGEGGEYSLAAQMVKNLPDGGAILGMWV